MFILIDHHYNVIAKDKLLKPIVFKTKASARQYVSLNKLTPNYKISTKKRLEKRK